MSEPVSSHPDLEVTEKTQGPPRPDIESLLNRAADSAVQRLERDWTSIGDSLDDYYMTRGEVACFMIPVMAYILAGYMIRQLLQ